MRCFLAASFVPALFLLLNCPVVSAQGALIAEPTAQQVGLTRAWYTQAQIAPELGSLVGTHLSGETLYLVSSTGSIQALDATTGGTRWASRLGSPTQPTYGPAVHGERVALVNGSQLYVLDASNGRELLRKQLGGAAGGGPALSETHAFVPLVNGRVEGFPFSKLRPITWRYNPGGTIFQSPTVVAGHVVWTTDRGELHGAYADGKGAAYRFRAAGRLVAPPTSSNGMVLVASESGLLYALDANQGNQRWRTTVGVGVNRPAVAVENRVYVGTEEPALHALDVLSGVQRWSVAGAEEFVALSGNKVYAYGPGGVLLAIDSKTGDVLAQCRTSGNLQPVLNDQTDWLYLVTPSGLVQCLHDLDSERPRRHDETDELVAADDAAGVADATAEAPPAADDPFSEPEEPSDTSTEDPPSDDATDTGPDPFGDFGDDDPFADF